MNKRFTFIAALACMSTMAFAEPNLNTALPPAIPFDGQAALPVGAVGAPMQGTGPATIVRQEEAITQPQANQGVQAVDFRVVLAMGNVAVVKEIDQGGKVLRTTTLHDGAQFRYQGRETKVAVKDGNFQLLEGRRTIASGQIDSIPEVADNAATRTAAETVLSAGQGVKELRSNQFSFASLQSGSGSGGNSNQVGNSNLAR
ncbi:hypothetical protein [Ralstonia pseudosolanacearum]|uniref:hypothetical protein n=1 Tax=Ralstonia pseudosolanacearum TaxID=1310165 RepID=UPI003CF9B4F1